jgi:hypothetical protein
MPQGHELTVKRGGARSLAAFQPNISADCIECGGRGVLTGGKRVHPNRQDLHERWYYVCACGARVGCHPGTTKPLGLPCGPATALARDKAHRAFDPIWKAKVDAGVRRATARDKAYGWLARELGIRRADCHISHMDEATCRRVIDACRTRRQA